MTESFYIKSISGASPDDGWCIQCDSCNQVVEESCSSEGTCLDCLFSEVQDLINERDFSQFTDIEVDQFFESVDIETWEVDFIFYYKDIKFYCNGLADGCENIGYTPFTMAVDTLKMNK